MTEEAAAIYCQAYIIERFFSGPRGTQQKNLQDSDSMQLKMGSAELELRM
jgi:hypothetical protein